MPNESSAASPSPRNGPTGRMRALAHENRRLHEALAFIAEHGDAHNAEVTRKRRAGEPESWAARFAYFVLYPEKQAGRG